MSMVKPPKTIDGATVLEWAWSGELPFGLLTYTSGETAAEIYGFAICSYPEATNVYRFSCNKNWEAEQDSPYESVEAAKDNIPSQYNNALVNWVKCK